MNREPIIDNAKFVLIFLVVFGHVIQPFKSELASIELLYHWIYLFHMPAFIFLSGFFAKGLGNKGYLSKLSKKLLLPYLIFHLFYTCYYLVLGVEGWELTILKPRWSLWFLLSLFCWHLMLIIFKKIPPVFSVIIAVEIGLIVGYVNGIGHTLSLSRTFVFFPFFLLGYWVTKKQLLLVKTKQMKIICGIIMTLVAIGIYIAPPFSSHWLLGSNSYQALGQPEFGGLLRLGIYFIAILMIISVFAWIPIKENRFTKIGESTIYVYLLHGIFIHFFRSTEILKINHFLDILGLALVSLIIVIILTCKPIKLLSQPLIEGKWTLLQQQRKRIHAYTRRIFDN